MNHMPFAGFDAFSTTMSEEPESELARTRLAAAIRLGKRHEAVGEHVGVFYEEAIRGSLDEDAAVDVWFVSSADEIYRYGRPRSILPKEEALQSRLVTAHQRVIYFSALALFTEENRDAETYLFEPNFHHQLKARLLDTEGVMLQILRQVRSVFWLQEVPTYMVGTSKIRRLLRGTSQRPYSLREAVIPGSWPL